MKPSLSISLFGRIELLPAGQSPISIPSKRAAALLAYMLMHEGQEVSRAALAKEFWPDSDLASARNNLRQAIFNLRKVLADAGTDPIQMEDEWLRLTPGIVETDYSQYLQLASSTQTVESWKTAAGLVSGEFLPGIDEPWALAARREFDENHLEVLFRLIRAEYERQDYSSALQFAETACEIDPLLERAHFAVVRLYVLKNQLSFARQIYDAFAQRLHNELEIQPSKSFATVVARARQSIEDDVWPQSENISKASDKKPKSALLRLGMVAAVVLIAAVVFSFVTKRAVQPKSFEEARAELVELSKQPQPSDEVMLRKAELLAQISERLWTDSYGEHEDEQFSELVPLFPEIARIETWCIENHTEFAIQIAGALQRYHYLGAKLEWLSLMDRALEKAPKTQTVFRARALAQWSNWACSYELVPKIPERLAEAKQIYEANHDVWGVAHVTRLEGFYQSWKRDVRSYPTLLSALHQFEKIGDEKGIAATALCMTFLVRFPPEYANQADSIRLEAAIRGVDAGIRGGNSWFLGMMGSNLAALSWQSSDLVPKELLREAHGAALKLAAWFESQLDSSNAGLYRLHALRIALKLKDQKLIVEGLNWCISDHYGNTLTFAERYYLALAVERLDPSGTVPRRFRDSQWFLDLPQQESERREILKWAERAKSMSTDELLQFVFH